MKAESMAKGETYIVEKGNAIFRKNDRVRLLPNRDLSCSYIEGGGGWIEQDFAGKAIKGVELMEVVFNEN